MASPHVAAAAALVAARSIDPVFDVNLNNAWDPQEVQAKLEATATNLGIEGRDNIYGYGLVNAFAAFTL